MFKATLDNLDQVKQSKGGGESSGVDSACLVHVVGSTLSTDNKERKRSVESKELTRNDSNRLKFEFCSEQHLWAKEVSTGNRLPQHPQWLPAGSSGKEKEAVLTEISQLLCIEFSSALLFHD